MTLLQTSPILIFLIPSSRGFLMGIMEVTDQAKEIKHLKAQIKKLKKKANPGRKPAKAKPTIHKDPAFDELDDDTMKTEDAQDVGRTSYVTVKVSDKPKVSTDKEEVSTDTPDECIARLNVDMDNCMKNFKRKSVKCTLLSRVTKFLNDTIAAKEDFIKEMNEQVADASKKRVKKDDSIKGEIKEEEGTRKRKLGIRKKMKSKKRKFTSKDHEELRLCLTIVSNEDKEVDYENLTRISDVTNCIKLKLKTKEDSTTALELVRFVKKQIVELESEDSHGDEKDL
ncbi:hypothetical protein Tco_1455938 [Tanacetum coccineum]